MSLRRRIVFSYMLIIAVGIYIGIHGWQGLAAQAAGEPPAIEQVDG